MFAALAATSHAQSIDFKGVRLGSPAADLAAVIPQAQFDTCTLATVQTADCLFRGVTYADIPNLTGAASFVNGRLDAIELMFEPQHFARIFRALQAKFGRPKIHVTVPKGNAFGAKVMDERAMWRDTAGNAISLSKFTDRIDEGFVSLESARRVAAEEAAAANARKPSRDI